MLTETLVLILFGRVDAFANLSWHQHTIPLSALPLFAGNGSLLKSNFVWSSPKSRSLMKRERAAANEERGKSEGASEQKRNDAEQNSRTLAPGLARPADDLKPPPPPSPP